MVYCPQGISFVKSVDASDIVKDATNLFFLFDEIITWVGPRNVVQMVTDNATNYVAIGRLVYEKDKHINWSPCGLIWKCLLTWLRANIRSTLTDDDGP